MSDPTSQEPSKAQELYLEFQKESHESRLGNPSRMYGVVEDLFIHLRALESETASLRAQLAETREIIASQCFNVGHSMYPVYKLSNRDCGGSSEWGENKCSRCGKSETWQYDF